MTLNLARVPGRTIAFDPVHYVRCIENQYTATPLGMGYGETRFASPTQSFKLIYIAIDLATAIAETVVRDRFEGSHPRQLVQADIDKWGAATVSAVRPLELLDLRGNGCFRIGVSTDITGAKAHAAARSLSQSVFDRTELDGILY